jgi:hypothetical protein
LISQGHDRDGIHEIDSPDSLYGCDEARILRRRNQSVRRVGRRTRWAPVSLARFAATCSIWA